MDAGADLDAVTSSRARYVVLDRRDGSTPETDIEAMAADWDAFLADMKPVIDRSEFNR